jgi:hypothetical protein
MLIIIRKDIFCVVFRNARVLKGTLSSGCICCGTTEVAECDCYCCITSKPLFGIDDLDVMTFRVTTGSGALDRGL